MTGRVQRKRHKTSVLGIPGPPEDVSLEDDGLMRPQRVIVIVLTGIGILGLIVAIVTAFRVMNPKERAGVDTMASGPVSDVLPDAAEQLEQKKNSKSSSATALFDAAMKAYGEGDKQSAERLLGQAQDGCDDKELLAKFFNLQGIIKFEEGQHPEAVARFLMAIRNDSKNAGYYFNWAEAIRAEGHSIAAVAPMNTASQLRPDDLVTRVKLNFLLIEAGQAESFAKKINELSGTGDLSLDLAFAKAALLVLNGQNEECDELLAKLKKKTPANVYAICLQDRLFQKRQVEGLKANDDRD
jgi:tetratricopeptide (TPR) repeat protein